VCRLRWYVVIIPVIAARSSVAQTPVQPTPVQPTATAVATTPSDSVRRPGTVDVARGLRPGDVVRLKIWREPDLSGDFTVDERGVVVFPKLGPHSVAGKSAAALKEQLISEYQVYLRNPSIDVMVLRRVNILGSVGTPGLYPVDPTTTVADALALAGGVSAEGDPNKVQLIRNGQRLTTKLEGGARLAESQIQSGDQIFVPERSWLSRNSRVMGSVITASVTLAIALFIRH
jgi:protein involved in polysaccharide export with SLBB domain